jgi:hypothetical protein
MNLKRAIKVFEDWYGFKHITNSGINYKEAWEVIRADIKEARPTVRPKRAAQNRQSKPCHCNVGVEYIPQSVRVCSNCGQPK